MLPIPVAYSHNDYYCDKGHPKNSSSSDPNFVDSRF